MFLLTTPLSSTFPLSPFPQSHIYLSNITDVTRLKVLRYFARQRWLTLLGTATQIALSPTTGAIALGSIVMKQMLYLQRWFQFHSTLYRKWTLLWIFLIVSSIGYESSAGLSLSKDKCSLSKMRELVPKERDYVSAQCYALHEREGVLPGLRNTSWVSIASLFWGGFEVYTKP